MTDEVIWRGPWQQLSSERVYENPWIAVDHQAVITPAGTEGVYGLVHFKSIALGIIPIDGQGNTRLVGQYRYALDEHSWEIPMGGGALANDPLQSAQRELQEETGLYGGRWQQLLKLHTSNSVTDESALVYLAFDLQQGEQKLEDSESDLQVKVLPLEEAVAMACRGEITDAISVAGLLATERLLRTGQST